MRVMHFGACFGILILCGIVFALTAAIARNTRLSDDPVWTQTCTLHRDYAAAELLCDGYQRQMEVNSIAVMGLKPVLLTCKAYPTRALDGKLDVQCDEPDAGAEF